MVKMIPKGMLLCYTHALGIRTYEYGISLAELDTVHPLILATKQVRIGKPIPGIVMNHWCEGRTAPFKQLGDYISEWTVTFRTAIVHMRLNQRPGCRVTHHYITKPVPIALAGSGWEGI